MVPEQNNHMLHSDIKMAQEVRKLTLYYLLLCVTTLFNVWTALGILILPLQQEIALSTKWDHPKTAFKTVEFCFQSWFTYTPPALSLPSTIPKPGPTSQMTTTLFHQDERRNPGNRAELQLAVKWFEFWANFLEIGDRTDWLKTTKGPSQVDPEK